MIAKVTKQSNESYIRVALHGCESYPMIEDRS
jgi:hypothetical protein